VAEYELDERPQDNQSVHDSDDTMRQTDGKNEDGMESELSNIVEGIACALYTLDVFLLQEGLDRLEKTLKANSALHDKSLTFLMSGIFGVKRCEICVITSWINGWFFIVLRAFMILKVNASAGANIHNSNRTHTGRLSLE